MRAYEAAPERGPRRALGRVGRASLIALGGLMLTLGIIGAFVPIMPTTIFLILATWCFGKSSPRLEARMLDHPRFGPMLRDWREHGAMPRRAKWMACGGMACGGMACGGMAFGYVMFVIGAHPGVWLATGMAALMLGGAAFVVSRPEPKEIAKATK